MSSKCLLLIDDEETIQEVVQVGIEIEVGWKVLIASSGLEGIALARKQHPDAILLDIMMPDMDGFSTFSRLQADNTTVSIPVIFLTAKNQPADNKQFQSIGVAGIITKPFNSMTLASRIAQILHWES